MKCPVCRTELNKDIDKCSNCGFCDLKKEFLNTEDAINWVEKVVNPYRKQWEVASQISIEGLFQKLVSERKRELQENAIATPEFTYEIENDGVRITHYNRKEPEVIIPQSINGKPVTAIADHLFSGIHELKSIVFPETIQVIPTHVCSECCNLETVIILGAKSIDSSAFANCIHLTKLILPSEMKRIGMMAFDNSRLTNVMLPSKLETIELFAFAGHTNLAFLDNNTDLSGYFDFKTRGIWGDARPIFYCNGGSTAQQYARKFGFQTKELNEFPTD